MMILTNLISFSGGILLGIIFFGGLKVTIKYLERVSHPAFMVLTVYLLRIIILFGGLALAASKAGLYGLISATLGITVILVVSIITNKRSKEA